MKGRCLTTGLPREVTLSPSETARALDPVAEELSRAVREGLEEYTGVLPFDDKASPEVIRREFGMTKNAFKRAVGHLLKEGEIEIRDHHIYLKKS